MPNTHTRQLELIGHISDRIVPLVTQAHQDLPAFTVATSPTPSLKLFPNGKGRPLFNLRRRRNRTLVLQPTLEDHPNVPIMDLPKYTYQAQVSLVTQELLTQILKSPLKGEMLHMVAASKHRASHITHYLRDIADALIADTATSYELDGVSKPIKGRKHRAEIGRALQNHFADADILHDAGIQYYSHENYANCVTLHQYNDLALNTQTYLRMNSEAPNVLKTFRNISRNNLELLQYPTPDHITRTVREALQLTPAQWRIFTQTPYTSRDEPQHHIIVLRTAMRLLTEVNIPLTTPGLTEVIVRMYPRHQWAVNHPPTWTYGDIWRTWVHIFHQAIANQNTKEKQQIYYHNDQDHLNLTAILDAFVYSVEHDLPWGHTDWESHIRRSQRIHARMVAELDFRENSPQSQVSWESLVDSMQVDDYDVAAVTDGISIKKLAETMRNCLAQYINDCNDGKLRIFSVHHQQRLVAAFAINRQEGRWAVWQVEKPNSRAANPAHIAVAVKLADHYNIVESNHARH